MSVKKVINFFIIFLLLFSFASCSFFNDTHIYNTANETQSNATNSTYTVNYTETTITTKKVLSNERAEYEKAIINIFTPDNQINNNDKVLRWKTNIKIKLIGEYSDKDKEIIDKKKDKETISVEVISTEERSEMNEREKENE